MGYGLHGMLIAETFHIHVESRATIQVLLAPLFSIRNPSRFSLAFSSILSRSGPGTQSIEVHLMWYVHKREKKNCRIGISK